MNYILYGEQYPMIRKRLNKILKESLGTPDDFNVVKIDFEQSSVNEIVNEAISLPLGYDRKAVVVDNANLISKSSKKDDVNAIKEIVFEPSTDIDIIFILRNANIDDKNPIVQNIKENGQVLQFLNLTKEEWPMYAKKYFKDRNVAITNDAIHELVQRVDGDLIRFINEADKLCLYKDDLNISDIVLMVSKPLEDDAFQMSNALFRGDNELAISIFRDLKLIGSKSIDPLIPMLASQFRFISEVCFLHSKGLDKKEIALELNVSDFRVAIALKNSKYLTRRQIAHALDDLYYLDYQIKSGQIDRSYGIELFLINFPN